MKATSHRCCVCLTRTWKYGQMALIEIKSTLGLGTRYLVARSLSNGNQLPVSWHRKKSAALRVVERLR